MSDHQQEEQLNQQQEEQQQQRQHDDDPYQSSEQQRPSSGGSNNNNNNPAAQEDVSDQNHHQHHKDPSESSTNNNHNNDSGHHHNEINHNNSKSYNERDQANDDIAEIIQGDASFFGQFIAAMRKNLIQKFRSPISLVMEMFLPVLFVVFSILIWIAVGSSSYPQKNFVHDEPFVNYTQRLYSAICVNATVSNIPGVATCPPTLPPGGGVCLSTAAHRVFKDGICTLVHPFALISLYGNASTARYPPTIPEMMIMHFAGRMGIDTDDENRMGRWNTLAGFYWGGRMAFAPNSVDTRNLVAYLNATHPIFREYGGAQIFETEAAATQWMGRRENEGSNWGLVVVNRLNPTGGFDVKLRFNRTSHVWSNDVIRRVYSGGVPAEDGAEAYLWSGFLGWQYEINQYYTTAVLGLPQPTQPVVSFMNTRAYTNWDFLVVGSSQGFIALFMVFSFLYPVSQITKSIVIEKELRIREAMLIMGLGSGSFYCSWFATYAIEFFVSSAVCTLLMKVTYLPQSDTFIIFFLHWGFAISSIMLSALMASIFSSSRIAALVSPIAYFIFSIPMFITSGLAPVIQWLFLFLSPTAMAMGFQLIADHEQNNGLGPTELASPLDDIPMIVVLIMIAIDCIIYLLLALYFDAVFPSEWGTSRNPCFCFIDPVRWCMRKDGESEEVPDNRDPNGFYEPINEKDLQRHKEDPENSPYKVQVKGILKEFTRGDDTFRAVDYLTWDLRENEVNVLLGHNGAGKTTAINLMTGMMTCDEGDTIIYGHSVRHDLGAVRREVGLCPQHNILWPDLTCAQHLRFFASLKGLSGDEREAAIDDMLEEVDLVDKRDYDAGDLSGGQKRKLSVAIAFIGGSRFVILDEPTAGMDVATRRHTWALIKKMKPGRTILLTTHFMDEADLLGDTINIMSAGHLKAQGSSMYLKNKLGVGYTLTLSIDSKKDSEPVKETILGIVPSAKHLPTGNEELAYRVPMHLTHLFPELLRSVEAMDERTTGVSGYGVSVTTLEEVFLRLAHDDALTVQQKVADEMAREASVGSGANPDAQAFPDPPTEATAVDVTPSEEPQPRTAHWTMVGDGPEYEKSVSFVGQFITLLIKRLHNGKRDRRTQFLQAGLPVICVLLAMLLLLLDFVPDSPSIYLNETMYDELELGNMDVVNSNCYEWNRTGDWPLRGYVDVNVPVNVTPNASVFMDKMVAETKNHGNPRYIAFYCNDNSMGRAAAPTQPNVSYVFFNASGYHTAGEALQFYYQRYVQSSTPGERLPPMSIASHNMDWTDKEAALIGNIQTFMVGLVIMIPFTFIPSTFVGWIVKEKQSRAKHLQMSSGMSYYAYWLSNFTFDVCSVLCTLMLVVIIFLIFDREEYIGDGESFGATFLLFIFYGFSGISTSYFAAHFFNEHSTAQNVVMMFNFICGFLLVLLAFFFQFFEATKDAGEVLRYFFRIVPAYCLGEGIINLASLGFARAFGWPVAPFDLDQVGWPLIYMAIEFPLFMALTMIVDHPARARSQQSLFHKPDEKPEQFDDEDPDVVAEREYIEGIDMDKIVENRDIYTSGSPLHSPANDNPDCPPGSENLVIVRHLNKEFGKKVAVRNMSFGVRLGEVFGFLGTNGAGKTTCISIMCGEQLPTRGRAYVAGFDCVEESDSAQRNMGYCPQFDALLDLLTPEEHLYLYAGLRGVNGSMRKTIVEELIEVCDLTNHRDTVASALSGGNKRKLSVALSLIGGPKVVFLDEPSAGMDPQARRGLWEVIDEVSKHCAVVLTTHHLEEVEALAHRVGIMVDGRFMCLGTKTHLKKKFGDGFEVNVRLRTEEAVAPFEQFMEESLPQAVLTERFGSRFTYSLPQDAVLSAAFEALESNKARLDMIDYSVSQTSIEQVFLRISEAALERERAEEAGEEVKQKDNVSVSASKQNSPKTKTSGNASFSQKEGEL